MSFSTGDEAHTNKSQTMEHQEVGEVDHKSVLVGVFAHPVSFPLECFTFSEFKRIWRIIIFKLIVSLSFFHLYFKTLFSQQKSQPRFLSVNQTGDIKDFSAFDVSEFESGQIPLPSTDPFVSGASLVVGRGCGSESDGIIATFGNGGTIGMWDIETARHISTRVLKGDKMKGSDVVACCGTKWAGSSSSLQSADGYMFIARSKSSTLTAIRLSPLGIAFDKQPSNLTHPTAYITAVCCHLDRPWVITALGMSSSSTQSSSNLDDHNQHTTSPTIDNHSMNFDGEIKIWDYSSLPESNDKKGRQRRETIAGGGGGGMESEYGGGGGGEEVLGEELLKGKLQVLAICRRGQNVPSSFGRLDVMSLAVIYASKIECYF